MIVDKGLRHIAKKYSLWAFISATFVIGGAQIDLSLLCCVLASCIGYALLWKSLTGLSSKKRFWISFFWFGALSSLHFSWFFSYRFQILPLIFVCYALLILAKGLGFGFFTNFLFSRRKIGILTVLAAAGLWTWIEYCFQRFLFFSGLPFDPLGLPLTVTPYGLQFASLGGVLGLSFWVVATNICGYRWLIENKGKKAFLFFALFPFVYGFFALHAPEKSSQELDIVVFQCPLNPEGSSLQVARRAARLVKQCSPFQGKKYDAAIFPEGLFLAPIERGVIRTHFLLASLEPTEKKIAQYLPDSPFISYREFMEALSLWMETPIIAGFASKDSNGSYNKAFLFDPKNKEIQEYAKRILVVGGEFLPFQDFLRKKSEGKWQRFFPKELCFDQLLTPGAKQKPLKVANACVCPTICYEELFGFLVRENCGRKSSWIVNLTNDADFPGSRLPLVHYHHARLRSVELGIPLVRACTIGVTAAVDSKGRLLGIVPFEGPAKKAKEEAFEVKLPLNSHGTFYGIWGDKGVLLLSSIFLVGQWVASCLKKENRAPCGLIS